MKTVVLTAGQTEIRPLPRRKPADLLFHGLLADRTHHIRHPPVGDGVLPGIKHPGHVFGISGKAQEHFLFPVLGQTVIVHGNIGLRLLPVQAFHHFRRVAGVVKRLVKGPFFRNTQLPHRRIQSRFLLPVLPEQAVQLLDIIVEQGVGERIFHAEIGQVFLKLRQVHGTPGAVDRRLPAPLFKICHNLLERPPLLHQLIHSHVGDLRNFIMKFPVYLRPHQLAERGDHFHVLVQLYRPDLDDLKRQMRSRQFFSIWILIPLQVKYYIFFHNGKIIY